MSYTSKQTAQESHAAEQQSARPTAQLFSDQRLSTSVQLKQQQMMNTVQCMSTEEEEPLQGKFATAQLAEEEELLQGKFATTQRAAMEEEEPVQGKFETLQRAGAEEEEPLQGKFTSTAPTQLEQKPNNTGLPDNLKSGIENMSGYSMDDVKVHYNSDKPAQLNAHAYAQGTDIHVAPGQEQHLPHEAWHVVQQKQGRVQPTMQMKAGVPVNDDAGLENEADVMGAKALGIGQLQRKANDSHHGQLNVMTTFSNTPIQCYLTRAESAAGDILHKARADIFEKATLDKYGPVARKWYSSWEEKVQAVTSAITTDRNLVYKRMSSATLTSYSGASSLAGDSREHMYVHIGNDIYRGDRTNEKLPHPALHGHDPDVDGAGTLRVTFNSDNKTLRVKVTNASGHFRPPQVDETTRAKVEEKVRNNKPRGTRVFVDISNH